jgi:hypothetical protein
MHVRLNLKTITFDLIKLATDFYGQPAIHWVKEPHRLIAWWMEMDRTNVGTSKEK